MKEFVKLDGEYVVKKSSRELRSTMLWGIIIAVVCTVAGCASWSIGLLANEPERIDSWFAVTRPVATAVLAILPSDAQALIMQVVAVVFWAFGAIIILLGIPMEHKLQRRVHENSKQSV